MKVKIVSDGTANGTRVYDAETGDKLMVSRLDLTLEAWKPIVCDLTYLTRTQRGGEETAPVEVVSLVLEGDLGQERKRPLTHSGRQKVLPLDTEQPVR